MGCFENRGAVVINEDVEPGGFWFCWKGTLAIPLKPWLVIAGFPILEDEKNGRNLYVLHII